MRRIIKGKAYDTSAAELIAEYSFGHPGEDEYYREALYCTRRNALFLLCEGGAKSGFAQIVGQGLSSPSEDVLPLTASEALRWLEDHEHTDAIEKLFDTCPEAGDGLELLWTRVPSALKEQIIDAAFDEAVSVEDWIAKALAKNLKSGKK